MRQVPNANNFHYAIIGDGRMAKHFCHYLDLLHLPYSQWSRKLNQKNQLKTIIKKSSHLLILISDSSINQFIMDNSIIDKKMIVHFSGRLISEFAWSAHPLMTFGPNLYDLTLYQNIPFFIEKEGPEFSDLLPGLANPNFKISSQQKPYYHALCVLSNNFTAILWQKFYNAMKNEFDIPKDVLIPFMHRTFLNIQEDHQNALTGPLVRNDKNTIKANLEALENDEFHQVYLAFIEAFQEAKEKQYEYS